MFSVLVQPAGIGHTVRMGRLLPPTTGEERVPLHRRMPYGPYSLASYLRRLHPRPLHGSGGLRSAPRGEADPVREGRLHLAHPGTRRASPGPQELGDHEPGRKAARHPSRFHDERFQRDHGPRRPKLTLTGHAVIMCRRHAPAAFLSSTGLLKMADCIGQIYPERGIARIRQALPLINVMKEPRLELCAQHDLAWFLNDAGKPEEALVVLDRARPVYQQFPDKWTQLRLHWLEGRIAANIGDLFEAETIFSQLWDEFRARNLNHELVLVSIDLAEVLVSRGEAARGVTLIKESYPIMQAWRLHRYALAAWIVFEKAVTQGEAGEIFRRIRDYYRRYWARPVA